MHLLSIKHSLMVNMKFRTWSMDDFRGVLSSTFRARRRHRGHWRKERITMKNTSLSYKTLRSSLIANAAALAVMIATALPQAARAENIQPPAVPGNIAVDAQYEPFLIGHATGTQNYVCLPQGANFAFVLFMPEATLFNQSGKQLTTHFFSPNPDENGTIRATWQHSRDTSAVWAQVKPGNASTDPAFVAPGAVAWLLLTVVGAKEGPGGGEALTDAKFIHRVNTTGGVAPSTGCGSAADVGRTAFVPYTADYIFYRQGYRCLSGRGCDSPAPLFKNQSTRVSGPGGLDVTCRGSADHRGRLYLPPSVHCVFSVLSVVKASPQSSQRAQSPQPHEHLCVRAVFRAEAPRDRDFEPDAA
jgi:hypothetical protein